MQIENHNYRLEFSEEQQSFHMELLFKSKRKENTNSYVTVIPNCTEVEKETLKGYLKFKSKSPNRKVTLEEVKKAVEELNNNFKKV